MAKIKIYSTATCVFCRAEKQYLDEKNIAYDVIMVDEDEAAADEMIKRSGQMGVPFTVITQDDGTEIDILGFDQPKLAAALGIN
jgi:glutaredoxin 3